MVEALLLIVLGLGTLLGFVAVALLSYHEGEPRGALIALIIAAVTSLPVLVTTLLPTLAQQVVLGLVFLVGLAGSVLFVLPVGQVELGPDVPTRRVDERDIMFARARLEPGSPKYESYYAMRPENKVGDDRTRSLPGLLSHDSSAANPMVFASTGASFGVTGALREAVDGPVSPERTECDAVTMSGYLKNLALFHGAHSVGITRLEPYHVYTHIGRGTGEYGAPITLKHQYAIAFTVEMDHSLVGTGPAAPTVLESARQYVKAAIIAIQLANLIRTQGYGARAHIDGNYRVIAPLVARDASLGEIGRMGLLMTPTLGPRVRLGVVTTEMPLVADRRGLDASVIDFCRVCKKCASACPAQAIPQGERTEIDGALRWRINADMCYRYWCVVGTDCGRCVAVCPYSHPDNAMHNLVRWSVRRSGMARRASIWLDDLIYGTNPRPKPSPSWIPSQSAQDQAITEVTPSRQ
jgi:ferredoxin